MKTFTEEQSSSVAGFEYNDADQELLVTFRSGGAYSYHSVPPEVVASFGLAESPGHFLNANIKGFYDFEKRDPQAQKPKQTEIAVGVKPLVEHLEKILTMVQALPKARQSAIAATKIEEAILWLGRP